MSVNKQILIGNVGRKPETRTFDNGDKIVSFSLATSERYKDRQGQQQEITQWHNVTVKNAKLADVVEQYVDKGSKLYVEGKLITRKFSKKDGSEGLAVETIVGPFGGEVTFLGGRDNNSGQGTGQGQFPTEKANGSFNQAPDGQPQPVAKELDDEIPF